MYRYVKGRQLRNKALLFTETKKLYNRKYILYNRPPKNKRNISLPTRRPRQPTSNPTTNKTSPPPLHNIQRPTNNKQVLPQFPTQPYPTRNGESTKKKESNRPRDLCRTLQRNKHTTKLYPRYQRDTTKASTNLQPTLKYIRSNTNNKPYHTKKSDMYKGNPNPRYQATTPPSKQTTNTKPTNTKQRDGLPTISNPKSTKEDPTTGKYYTTRLYRLPQTKPQLMPRHYTRQT